MGSNWTDECEEFGRSVAARMQKSLNSEMFWHELRGAAYAATLFQGEDGAQSETPASEVLEAIRMGLERGTISDSEIDLQVHLGFSFRWRRRWRRRILPKVLGSTTPGGPTITTNGYYFLDALESPQGPDYADIASHWMHEWMHVAGFVHRRNRSRGDVAYVVGNIMEDVVDSIEGR
jgi:hypothetical protein